MHSIFKWLGVLQSILLSSLSSQMEQASSLGGFCSDKIPIIHNSKDKNILIQGDTNKNQEVYAPKNLSNFFDKNSQSDSPGSRARYSAHGFYQIKLSAIPNLDLSLGNCPEYKITKFQNPKELYGSTGIYDQKIHMHTQFKEEDVNDTFQTSRQSLSQLGQGEISKSHAESLGTSWLTLVNADKGSKQDLTEKLPMIESHARSAGLRQQMDLKRSWLSLGYEDSLEKGHSGIQYPGFDTTTYAMGANSKDVSARLSTRGSMNMLSIPTLNDLSEQSFISRGPTSVKSPKKPELQMAPTNSRALVDQQYPHKGKYMESIFQKNQKKLRGSGSKRKNDLNPHTQNLENESYMRSAENKLVEMSTSSKRQQVLSKEKEMEVISDTHPQNLSPDINLINTIKEISISQKLIPQDLCKQIHTWFSMLGKNMWASKKDFKHSQQKTIHGLKNYVPAVSKAEIYATSFLTCLKLLHVEQNHNVQSWEEPLLEDGWDFIKRIFDHWNMVEWKLLERTKRNEHVNDLQPEVLYDYLAQTKLKNFTVKNLWGFWKKWYRESTYPNKRFLAIETCFVKHIQKSILCYGKNQINFQKDREAILQSFEWIDRIESHQEMLKEYSLQFNWHEKYSPNCIMNNYHLESMMQHVGQFELDLLEHHEPVVEWLESLLQDLQNELINQVPAKEKDITVLNAWTFLKTHLDHWRNMDLNNALHPGNSSHAFENDHLGESYSLFVKMLKTKNSDHIPLKIITKLYYLERLSFGDQIVQQDWRFYHNQLKRTMNNIFVSLQTQLT